MPSTGIASRGLQSGLNRTGLSLLALRLFACPVRGLRPVASLSPMAAVGRTSYLEISDAPSVLNLVPKVALRSVGPAFGHT